MKVMSSFSQKWEKKVKDPFFYEWQVYITKNNYIVNFVLLIKKVLLSKNNFWWVEGFLLNLNKSLKAYAGNVSSENTNSWVRIVNNAVTVQFIILFRYLK